MPSRADFFGYHVQVKQDVQSFSFSFLINKKDPYIKKTTLCKGAQTSQMVQRKKEKEKSLKLNYKRKENFLLSLRIGF